jgi:serine/threonine protein kinase
MNVLVDSSLSCKLCDFGLSRLFAADNQTFAKLCGTPAYVAPEIFQHSENSKATSKSDVYSMGIVLWELFNTLMIKTYTPPFAEYGLAGQSIFAEAALSGKRPTLQKDCPVILQELYFLSVLEDPFRRPTAERVAETLITAKKSYTENPEVFFKVPEVEDLPLSNLSSSLPSNELHSSDTVKASNSF